MKVRGITTALVMSVILGAFTALAGPKDGTPPLPRVVIIKPSTSPMFEVRALHLQWIAPNNLEIAGRIANISSTKLFNAIDVLSILLDKDGDTLAARKITSIIPVLLSPGMTTKFGGVFEVVQGASSFMLVFQEGAGHDVRTRFDDALVQELHAIMK
jgi:hypothetical protein